MTYLPAAASHVLNGTPVFGQVEHVEAMSRFASDVRHDCTMYALGVGGAQASLVSLESRGVATLQSKIEGRVLPGSEALRQTADDAKRAFDRYASEIDRIHRAAARTEERVETALATIREDMRTIEMICEEIGAAASYGWREGPPGEMPEPRLTSNAAGFDQAERATAVRLLRSAHESSWVRAAVSWSRAIEDVERAESEWSRLIEERRGAEQALIAVLRSTTVGQLIRVSGSSESARRAAISQTFAGEIWGEVAPAVRIETSHPLLLKLIGSASGAQIWDAPPMAEEVTAAWHRLTAEEQQRLIAEVPWVIGNLPGLPFDVRDAANRRLTETYRGHPEQLTPDQLKLMAGLSDILALESQEIEEYGAGRPPIQIVSLNLFGSVPRVAVGYGNLDASSHRTWQIGGMNNDAHEALAGWDTSSRNLLQRQEFVTGGQGANSLVVWLGYDAPNSSDSLNSNGVLAPGKARVGAPRLAAELDGAYAASAFGGKEAPVTSVLAHSYGTTVAAMGLTQVRHEVDSFVMLGSAGLDPQTVPSLDTVRVREVGPGQQAIYATHASSDQLAPSGAGLAGRGVPTAGALGAFGMHNFSAVYEGALVFSSEGDAEAGLKPTDGHSAIGSGANPGFLGVSASAGHGYLDEGTQSLASVATITAGVMSDDFQSSLIRSDATYVVFETGAGRGAVPVRTGNE